jgi:hypothetical protein
VIEFLAPGFLYSLAKDGIKVLLGKKRRLSPSEIIEHRQKWKPLFEQEVWKNHKEQLRSDVIVRDMRRFDNYPDAMETKGISPWFRVGLIDTYHRGILVGLNWGTLTRGDDGEQWRFTNYAKKESGDIKVILVGSIPYENIENVDWTGDEYYAYPHIYCYFAHKKEPYERLTFCAKNTPLDRPPFYTEIAPYESVRSLSKAHGIRHFG